PVRNGERRTAPIKRSGRRSAGKQSETRAGERNAFAITLIVAASCFVPISDGIAKQLTDVLPILQVAFLRYAVQTALLAPFVFRRYGRAAITPQQPWAQLARSLLIISTTIFLYLALSKMPLADAIAIFFFSPFLVTALSPLVLKERVGIWRWSAVIVGLIGVMIVICPGFQSVGLGTLYAIASGASFAVFVLTTRSIRGRDAPLITSFVTGVICAVLLGLTLPFVWQPVETHTLPLLILLGLFGTAFSICIVLAYEYGDASMLAPFSYVELVAAAAVGFVMFGDLPDGLTWLGIATILLAGVTIAIREGRRNTTSSAAPRVRR
ncbi:MAG: DMT family transporter, partial [Pseudomonadota bacterium]